MRKFFENDRKNLALNKLLYEACIDPHYKLEYIEDLISQGACVTDGYFFGDDLLYKVFERNPKPELIKFLIEKKANPNMQYHDGTLLHRLFSARRGFFPAEELTEQDYLLIETLLQNGADPNLSIDFGHNNHGTCLHHAAEEGKITRRLVQLFCQYGGDPTIRDKWGKTALSCLLQQRKKITEKEIKLDLEVVDLLLKYQKQIHIDEEKSATYLHLYCTVDAFNLQGFKLFMQHGYDPHAKVGHNGNCLLILLGHLPKRKLDLSLLHYLVQELKMDISGTIDDEGGCLHVALRRGLKFEIIQFLFNNSCPQGSMSDQRTLLHSACENRNTSLEVLRYLIETNGMDPNARDHDGSTSLHIVCTNKKLSIDILHYLVGEMKADPNAQNKMGQTSLHLIFYNKKVSTDMLNYLGREKKADVNLLDNQKRTCLHQLIDIGLYKENQNQQLELIHTLIQLKVNLNQQDSKGKTVWHYLCSEFNPNFEKMRLLIENGLDMNLKDHEQNTGFQILFNSGKLKYHFAIEHIEYFIDKGFSIDNLSESQKRYVLDELLVNENYRIFLKIIILCDWKSQAFLKIIKEMYKQLNIWLTHNQEQNQLFKNKELFMNFIQCLYYMNQNDKEKAICFIKDNLMLQSFSERYKHASIIDQQRISTWMHISHILKTKNRGIFNKYINTIIRDNLITQNEHALNLMSQVVNNLNESKANSGYKHF